MGATSSECDESAQAGAELWTQASPTLFATVSSDQVKTVTPTDLYITDAADLF